MYAAIHQAQVTLGSAEACTRRLAEEALPMIRSRWNSKAYYVLEFIPI